MKINKNFIGELNKKMWRISKKNTGLVCERAQGELLTPQVELNEDLRYQFWALNSGQNSVFIFAISA